MRIIHRTPVKGDFKSVFAGFDKSLFVFLAPPFPKLVVKRFDGSHVGNEVHLQMLFPGSKVDWISIITEEEVNEDHAFFVDEGTVMPFGLKYWRHKHLIERGDSGSSMIVDDLEYKTGLKLFDLILYPVFFMFFKQRYPLYRKFFGKI